MDEQGKNEGKSMNLATGIPKARAEWGIKAHSVDPLSSLGA